MPPPARTRTAQNNRYRREKRPDPQTGARRNQVVARSGLPTPATSRESGSTSRRRTAQCWPGVAALDRMQARSGLPFPSPNDKQCRTCLEKPSSRALGWLAAAQFPAGARRKFRERRPADRSSRGLQTSATARPVAASASPSSEHDSTWSAPTRWGCRRPSEPRGPVRDRWPFPAGRGSARNLWTRTGARHGAHHRARPHIAPCTANSAVTLNPGFPFGNAGQTDNVYTLSPPDASVSVSALPAHGHAGCLGNELAAWHRLSGSFACCPCRSEVRSSWLPILPIKGFRMNELTVVDKATEWPLSGSVRRSSSSLGSNPVSDKSKSAAASSCNSKERSSSSQSAQVTDLFTISRNALTWASVHSSHRITGIPVVSPPGHDPNLRAALIRRWPSTTVPSLRASTGILKPNSRMDAHIRTVHGVGYRFLPVGSREVPQQIRRRLNAGLTAVGSNCNHDRSLDARRPLLAGTIQTNRKGIVGR